MTCHLPLYESLHLILIIITSGIFAACIIAIIYQVTLSEFFYICQFLLQSLYINDFNVFTLFYDSNFTLAFQTISNNESCHLEKDIKCYHSQIAKYHISITNIIISLKYWALYHS